MSDSVSSYFEAHCYQHPMPGGPLDLAVRHYEALKAALISAIVCDTCLGARRISNQCVSCLGGSDAPCTCDDLPEFDCPQCEGLGWYHREGKKFEAICEALYQEHLNYLPSPRSGSAEDRR